MGSPHVLPNGQPGLSLRMGKMKAGPVVSDNGNFIIDAPFAEELMRQPEEVRASLWSFFSSLPPGHTVDKKHFRLVVSYFSCCTRSKC